VTDTDTLISYLRSPNEDVRRRASAQLAKSSDPNTGARVAELLSDSVGWAVAAAVDILGDRADAETTDALERFADIDDRFDLVWRARHALQAIAGRVPPGRPDAAAMRRAYSPEFVIDAMTWRSAADWTLPGPDGDGFVIAVLPPFHAELLVVVSHGGVALWFQQSPLWAGIHEHGRWYPSAYRMVLTDDRTTVEQFGALVETGFDGEDSAFGADGVTLGGHRVESGKRRPLPQRWLTEGPLAELLLAVRTLGMDVASHELEFDRLQDLGVYLGVRLEVSFTDFPVPAVGLSGSCDGEAFANVLQRHPRAPMIVDLTRLRFLAPDLVPQFASWLDAGDAQVIGERTNPYLASLPRLHASWIDALGATTDATGPLELIGYWTADEGDGLPHPNDFIAEASDSKVENDLADLLDDGIPYRYFMGFSPCRICGKHNGSAELTDGRFAWPEGLSHYVRDHHVQLPPAITHVIRPRPSVEAGRWLIPSMLAGRERSTSLWIDAMGAERG
jgi:hypothetical protein